MLFSTHASHVSLLYSICIYKYIEFIFREFYMKKRPKFLYLLLFIVTGHKRRGASPVIYVKASSSIAHHVLQLESV